MSAMLDTPRTEPEELLQGLKRGDNRSYEEVVRRYGGRMLGISTRILGSREDARDCVQEAFLQAFSAIERFEGRSSLWTWLHRIAVNSALLKLRARRRRPERSLDELMPAFDDYQCRIEPRSAVHRSAETLVRERETREMVREAIYSLPGDYRDVLLLRDIEELDTRQTSDILGIGTGAVKRLVFRLHLLLCRECRDYLMSYTRAIELGKAVFRHPDEPVPEEVPDDLVRAILAARERADG
jgi:RNA polymerase sigma-70 factor (ECF subfamily)